MTRITRPALKREIRAQQKSYDVASSGRLFISVPGADLELSSHASEKVQVDVIVNSHSENEAHALLDRMKLRIRAIDKQTVRIESRSFYSEGFIGWNSEDTLEMKLVVRLPESFNVDLQTAGSRIDLNNINGRLTLQGSGGTLHANNLKGRLEIYGFGCDIHVNDFDGSKLSLVAAASTIHTSQIKAKTISIRASSCTSTVAHLDGQTSLYLHSGKADVSHVIGPLDVQSQGCASTFYIDTVDDTALSIRGGELGLHITRNLEARLLLEGDNIYFDDSLSFSGDKEIDRIEGQLNEGNNLLHAHAAAASIRCLPLE